MSVFKYIFDSEWSQRSDIEKLKVQAARSSKHAEFAKATQKARIAELERDVGELALLSKALMQIILERQLCTGEELEALMREIDLADGVEDGRISKGEVKKKRKRKGCGRTVSRKRKKCLYCGEPQ